MRPLFAAFTAIVVVIAVLGCSSPGEPFRYRELKVYPGISLSPTSTPATSQTETISFGAFNTDMGAPMNNMVWQVVRTDSLGANPVTIGTGTVNLSSDSWQSLSVTDLPPFAGTNGTFIYTVTLDPANLIINRTLTANNTATVTITWADLNLSFVTVPTVALVASQPVITATVLNTDTSGVVPPAAATAPKVQLGVTDETGFNWTLAATIAPIAPPLGAFPDLATGTQQGYTITLPVGAVGHTLTVTIDPANLIPERTKADNALIAIPVSPN